MAIPSSKFLNNLFLIIATITILIIWVTQITSLNNGSYVLRQADLFKIDSVKMLSRAYIIGGGKSSKSIEFGDENGKTFSLSGPRHSALSKKSGLYDTLQYSGLIMTVLTDKEGFDRYKNKSNSEKIDVYDIQIDGTSFISLEEVNGKEYDRILSLLVFFSIAYGIYLIFYFHYRMKE